MRLDVLQEFADAQHLGNGWRFDHNELRRRVRTDRSEYQREWWAANRDRVNARNRANYNPAAERARKLATYYADVEMSRARGRECAKRRYHQVLKSDPIYVAKNRARANAYYHARKNDPEFREKISARARAWYVAKKKRAA